MKKKVVVLLLSLCVATNGAGISASAAAPGEGVAVFSEAAVEAEAEDAEEQTDADDAEEQTDADDAQEAEVVSDESEIAPIEATSADGDVIVPDEVTIAEEEGFGPPIAVVLDEEESDNSEAIDETVIDEKKDGEIEEEEEFTNVLHGSYNGFEYSIKTPYRQDSYVVIDRYTGNGGNITIPEWIEGKRVTEIGSSAFAEKSGITSVTLPNSITKIGSKAFYRCSGMERLKLNEGITEIGSAAFELCSNLTTITLPSTLETANTSTWYNGVFQDCSGLTSVTIKGKTVGARMFMGCTNLTTVKVPSSVTYVGDEAFMNCTSLTSATIEAPAEIGDSAFNGCAYLEKVTLKNITKIGNSAFAGTLLKSVNIPSTVKSIDTAAFSDCVELTTVTLNQGLETIGQQAFYKCYSLKTITIPSTVTHVYPDSTWYNGAFQDCTSLEKVTMNGTSVGCYMFAGCTALKEITLPRTVVGIGDRAFENCAALTKATINCAGEIGDEAFVGCENLKTVTLQNSLVSVIASSAFENTPVESISLPKTVSTIESSAFKGCTKLSKLKLNQGLLTLGMSCFNNCTSLKEVTIPSTVTKVEGSSWYNGVFQGCTALRDITLKNNTVGVSMFRGCTSLQNIVIPVSVKTLNDSAFRDCSGLKAAEFLGNAPASFGSNVFDGTNGAFEITYFSGKTGWTTPTWKDYKTRAITKLEGDVCAIFEDVTPNDWYVNAVQAIYNKGIMSGTAQTVFKPNQPILRQEFTQVLYNHADKPNVTIANPFTDVKNEWYKNSVLWAKQKGIANGKGNGIFGIGQKITREELALMLYKYAKLQGYSITKTAGATAGYADSNKVQTWSKEALEWAISQGIMSGKGTAGQPKSTFRLDPQGNATRAECASMIQKLLEKNGR